MGQVQGGHLRLLGRTVDLDILHCDDQRRSRTTQLINVHGQHTKLSLYEDNEKDMVSKPASRFCCLLLDLSLGDHPKFNGLVLGRTGEADSVYRRAGSLTSSPNELDIEDFLNDPLLVLAGDIRREEDGTRVFERDSSALREIMII